MLSKFDFFGDKNNILVGEEWRASLKQALIDQLTPDGDISFIGGGTLGVCALLEVSGRRRFIKSHLPDDLCRSNLAKEGGLLAVLYGASIGLERFDVHGMDRQSCLMMDRLEPLDVPMEPDDAWALAVDMAEKLRRYPAASMIDFDQLLDIGDLALAELAKASQVDPLLRYAVEKRLWRLRNEQTRLEPSICHGDFGPRNILRDSKPVVIDWEDAFLGVAGYDYIYWLSFMDNRKFYPVAFGRTPYGRSLEVDMLTLVIVLKAALSVRSGDYLRHRTRIDARIGEVLALDT